MLLGSGASRTFASTSRDEAEVRHICAITPRKLLCGLALQGSLAA